LLLCSLWGNRSDLSLSSGNVDANVAEGGASGKLIIDDSQTAERILLAGSPTETKLIIMVLDNCGAELLADLRFAEYLVKNLNYTVSLHVKPHPVFVSDATRFDVFKHVDRLCENRIPIGESLKSLIAESKLQIFENNFYTSPLELPFAPLDPKRQYSLAHMIIVKGDANYRRILCDRHFPHDFPFNELVAAVTEQPLLAIRTCKSPVIVGLPKGILHQVQVVDANWCVNGTCGVLQLAAGHGIASLGKI
jgi:Damage-control phosphatase ARMT1-like domain